MPRARYILLVDDEADFRSELAAQLRLHGGCEVMEAGTGAEALEAAKNHVFDAIVLDVGLPDQDGRDVCRLLRRQGVKAPIVMLTAHAGNDDTIPRLDFGASDCVTKPVRLGVLLARLRAQLRQFELSDQAVFQIGPYRFRPAARMLETADGRRIHLTEKETAILEYLYRVGDRTVSREVLLREVWGYNPGVTTHTLETHVYRLRQKIEPDPERNTLLVTEAGGYRLMR